MNIEFLTNLGLSDEVCSAILDEVSSSLEAEYNRGLKEGFEKLDEFKFMQSITDELNKTNAKNPEILKSLIDFEAVSFENGEVVGLTEQIELLREENPFLFEEETVSPKFSRRPKSSGEITKKDFDSMAYKERVSLFSKNPALYKRLKG